MKVADEIRTNKKGKALRDKIYTVFRKMIMVQKVLQPYQRLQQQKTKQKKTKNRKKSQQKNLHSICLHNKEKGRQRL